MYELIIALDYKGKSSLYHQIYEKIKKEIINNKLKRNEKLPSKRFLANYLGVSINTVDTAYQCLVAEGYLEAKARKGYFVCTIENLEFEKHEKLETSNLEEKKSYEIDFSPSNIDSENFPWNHWRKTYKAVLEMENDSFLKKSSFFGEQDLREEIANYLYNSRAVNCSFEQVIISSGTDYMLMLIAKLFEEKTKIGIENPAYAKTYSIFNNMGFKTLPIEVDNMGLSFKALSKTNAKLLYITPSHQFPLGMVMPIGRRIELLNWANLENDRFIIEDDYDSEFRYSGRPIPSMQSLDSGFKVIYLGTFSKSIAPSIRLSYMVLPLNLLAIFKEKFKYYDSPVSILEQKALNLFLKEKYFERHLNKMRKKYKQKIEFLIKELSIFKDSISISGDSAGHHILVKFKQKLNEKELCELAGKKGLKIYPVSDYFIGKPPNEFSSTIILGYAGLNLDEIKKGLILLFNIINAF